MPREAQTQVTVDDFAGLANNADSADLPPGAAADQVNATSIVPGELRVRQGMTPVTFEPFE